MILRHGLVIAARGWWSFLAHSTAVVGYQSFKIGNRLNDLRNHSNGAAAQFNKIAMNEVDVKQIRSVRDMRQSERVEIVTVFGTVWHVVCSALPARHVQE